MHTIVPKNSTFSPCRGFNMNKHCFNSTSNRFRILCKANMDASHSLQALTLIASLGQVFSGDDEALKAACMSTMTPNALRDFLEKIVSGDMDEARPWMRAIGEAFSTNPYTNFHPLLRAMPNRNLQDLKEAVERQEFIRQKFCMFKYCDEKTARGKPNGYALKGEFGEGEFGYFVGLQWDDQKRDYVDKALTENDLERLAEYPECCYYYGQPCYCWQCDDDSEDCECVLGREYYSLVLEPLHDN